MSQISAKIIAHSKSAVTGKEIVTFELIYPRFIHSEFLTHRMFSRNAASSRAIPVNKMIEQVRNDPAKPVHWGKNQPGMQAKEELMGTDLANIRWGWQRAAEDAAGWAEVMSIDGAHKQIANRILEPFQWMKTVVTATEWENFFWLRNHEDAQPEIKRLAEVMLEALEVNRCMVVELDSGDWHTPYYECGYWLKEHQDTTGWYDKNGVSLEDALAISSSCCAQVSYRLLDDSLEKARMIYKRLVESEPVHASPFEHQASPVKFETALEQTLSYMSKESDEITQDDTEWEDGLTHCDREGYFWSGNFKGWIQHRQLIPNNVKM